MEPIIKTIVVGALESNCYIFADPDSKEAAIIDPGADGDSIKSAIKELGVTVKCIINTHGHGDHISSNGKLDAPIYIHKLDAGFLEAPGLNLSAAYGLEIKSPPATHQIEEGHIIEIGRFKLKVIHTPGHTPGSISLLGDGVAFTGDTLFMGGVGRTDFPYGSNEKLMDSIKNKLFTLEKETIVYPGHGPSTTIGREKCEGDCINLNSI